MADQLVVLTLVADRLEQAGIAYMVTGSIAAGHYGQPRMTRDIDIVAALVPLHATRLVEALGPAFIFDVEMIAAAIAARRPFNLFHREALQKVDFIVRESTDYELEKFERRQKVDIDGHPIWMITPEDLILSKLVWAKDSRSELQFRDVRSIMQLQPDLDWAYIDRWSMRLTVAALLRELRP